MNNWKASLDRYLTREPPDYAWWFEKCFNCVEATDEQIEKHEKLIDKWMDRLFDKNYEPEDAAKVISRGLIRFYPCG